MLQRAATPRFDLTGAKTGIKHLPLTLQKTPPTARQRVNERRAAKTGLFGRGQGRQVPVFSKFQKVFLDVGAGRRAVQVAGELLGCQELKDSQRLKYGPLRLTQLRC